jgi:MFS family permease
MKKLQYGWVICIASALLLFCTGGLAVTGFSAYQPYLISIGGLTNTQSSSVIFSRTLFILFGMLLANHLIRLFEIRRVVTAALVLCSGAFFLFGISTNFYMYCLAAAITGIAVGFGGLIAASVLIARWFNEHRGLAIGISMAATGLSALVASPFITFVVEHHSLRVSFFAEGVFIAFIAIIVYLAVRSMPECLDAVPVGAEHLEASHAYAAKDAPAFLYLGMMAGVMLFGMPGNVFASHISVIYRTSGFSSGDIAIMISIFGIMLALGKCTYGLIADKIGTYRASWILYIFVLIGVGIACFADNGNRIIAFAGVAVAGIGFAVTTVSPTIYAATVSTEKNYGKSVSRFQILSNIGSLVFGTVPGMIADATNSYIPAVVIMFGISLISSFMLQIFCRAIQVQDEAYRKTMEA